MYDFALKRAPIFATRSFSAWFMVFMPLLFLILPTSPLRCLALNYIINEDAAYVSSGFIEP
jgi:hypothetical protein